jgi:hypothetical protein
MAEKHIYKVVFVNKQQTYEIYVKHVYQGEMYGFIVVEDFVFGEKSSIVVDPSEDKLRSEFEGVKRSFIPIHEVVRIDQVKKRGVPRIFEADKSVSSGNRNVATFHSPDRK